MKKFLWSLLLLLPQISVGQSLLTDPLRINIVQSVDSDIRQRIDQLYKLGGGKIDPAKFEGILFLSRSPDDSYVLRSISIQMWLTDRELWLIYRDEDISFHKLLPYPKGDAFATVYAKLLTRDKTLEQNTSFYTVTGNKSQDDQQATKYFGTGRLVNNGKLVFWDNGN